jgi:hypothetical protein
MACAGQPDGLRSLPGTYIENASQVRPQVPVELAGDHFLPDHVPHLVQPAQPGRPGNTERAVRDGVAAHLVPVAYHRRSISCTGRAFLASGSVPERVLNTRSVV